MAEQEEAVSSKVLGSKVFDRIKSDSRVNSELDHCLYCEVRDVETRNIKRDAIKLDCVSGNDIKQCPICKRIYILKDPI